MIAKKIRYDRERDASRSIIANVRRMARYVTAGQAGDLPLLVSTDSPAAEARVHRVFTWGFVSDNLASQITEMAVLANSAMRSPQPVDHWLLSWREGESPSDADIADALEIFLNELGLRGHQVIAAVHVDTANVHVHVLINRVDCLSGLTVTAGGGFDLEAAHRAIARIVHVQGWKSEPNARYRVDEVSSALIRVGDEAVLNLSSGAAAMEIRQGLQSAERIAQLELAPLAAMATSWSALHRQFAERGAEFVQHGSGAAVLIHSEHPGSGEVEKVAVRASKMGRQFSFSRMTSSARLGPYVPRDADTVITPRQPEAVRSENNVWVLAYRQARQQHHSEREAMRVRHLAQNRSLQRCHADERAELCVPGAWTGRGRELNARRRALAAQHRDQRERMLLRHKAERSDIAAKAAVLIDYETWLRHTIGDQAGEEFRYGDSIRNEIGVSSLRSKSGDEVIAAAVIQEPGWEKRSGRNFVHLTDRRASVLDALQDAHACSSGPLELCGSASFRDLALRLAAQHEIKIKNPALVPAWRLERARWEQAGQPDPHREMFYDAVRSMHAALRADGYLISLDVLPQPGRDVISRILGRAEQARTGFTAEQLMLAYPRLTEAAHEGVLRCLPLSRRWLYAVIGDLTPKAVTRFEQSERVRPALHVSEFGRVSTLVLRDQRSDDRLLHPVQSELDRLVSKHSMDQTNRFGFLLPGLKSRWMEAEITHSQDVDCGIATRLKSTVVNATITSDQSGLVGPEEATEALRAFRMHRQDVLGRTRRRLAPSVVDVRVVVRLLITGHDQAAVREALLASIDPARRTRDNRDWERYAGRTLDYAAGVAGSSEVRRKEHMKDAWIRLEAGLGVNVVANVAGPVDDEDDAREKVQDVETEAPMIWTPKLFGGGKA